jgi:LysM repeat protein
MQLLKQSTASTVYVGPVLDSAGAAVTTAVVGDFRLVKNGTAATLSGATVTHDANGYYTVALTTTNTDTTGRLTLAVGNTAMSMSTHRFSVLLASVFDALITNATNATGGLPTATAAISALAGAISTLTAGGVRTELTTELGRLDAAVSSRMASYTQPTGFLAATFPTTVASPTNITSATGVTLAATTHTGAVIPTVSTVTNGVTVSTNSDKTGYSLSQSFPSNFASLGINASGHVSRVVLVDTVSAVTGLTASNLDAAVSSRLAPTVSGRTLDVTATGAAGIDWGNIENQGSQVVLYDTSIQNVTSVDQTDSVISLAAGATISGGVDDEIAAAVAATQALSRLDSMIESDGAGQFRFDTIALEQAPAGGGGGTDWTANERTAIRSILGIPTSGTTPTDPTVGILDTIRDKTNLITTGTIASSIPVTASGQIDGPLVVGDDYLSANGRAFIWTVALPSAFVIATSTCKFGMEYQDEEGTYSFNVTGTVADAGSGNVTLTFDVPKATTGLLGPGWYRWSVEIASASGTEVTRVKSSHNKLVEWVEKQT